MDMKVGRDILDQKITQKNYKMKNILCLLALIFLSCNGQERKNIKLEKSKISIIEKDLEKLLFCDKFDVRDGFYQIPDYGCLYNNTTNKLGNADVIIIPKTTKFQTNVVDSKCLDDIDCLNKIYADINKLSIKEFKNNFDAAIFIINKRDLKSTQDLDQPYNPKMPYKINSYLLKNNFWEEGEKIEVNNDNDITKEKIGKNKLYKNL